MFSSHTVCKNCRVMEAFTLTSKKGPGGQVLCRWEDDAWSCENKAESTVEAPGSWRCQEHGMKKARDFWCWELSPGLYTCTISLNWHPSLPSWSPDHALDFMATFMCWISVFSYLSQSACVEFIIFITLFQLTLMLTFFPHPQNKVIHSGNWESYKWIARFTRRQRVVALVTISEKTASTTLVIVPGM